MATICGDIVAVRSGAGVPGPGPAGTTAAGGASTMPGAPTDGTTGVTGFGLLLVKRPMRCNLQSQRFGPVSPPYADRFSADDRPSSCVASAMRLWLISDRGARST